MRTANKYLLFGICLGILFPVLALIWDTTISKDLTINGYNILATYRSSFLHIIISTAPLFLGVSFLIAGIKAEKMERSNLILKANNESLLEINHILDEFNYNVTHNLKTSLIEMESLSLMIKKHAHNDERRDDIILKLLSSAKNGTSVVDDFTKKVDDVRDNCKNLNSDNSDTTTSENRSSILIQKRFPISISNTSKASSLKVQLSRIS